MKTRILKKIRHAFNKHYRFEETFEREGNGNTVPLYRVCDLSWDYDSCYYIVNEGKNKLEIKNAYINLYRKWVFKSLDNYYSNYNKKPKSVRQKYNDVNILANCAKTYNNNKIKI